MTLVFWRIDVEFGSVLAMVEGIVLSDIFGKRKTYLGK